MPLIPLSRRKHYDFIPGTFDVRGWQVRTQRDNQGVGKVEDVLLDDRGRPRYLDVDLGLFSKHVLLPLRRAHVDTGDEVVWVDGMEKDQFKAIPEYSLDPETLTPAYETRLEKDYDAVVEGDGLATGADADLAAREGISRSEAHRFARLGDMEHYRVSGTDSDPRGWDVVAGDGTTIGEVSELIVDTNSMQARYIDCDVEEKKLELEALDRHVLIPVDRSHLDRDKRKVVVDGIFARDIATYPVYGGLPLTSDIERRLDGVFDREDAAVRPAEETGSQARRIDDGYDHDAAAFFAPRRDTVTTERVAGDEAVIRNKDQEVRIRVSGDDIVIEKRPRA